MIKNNEIAHLLKSENKVGTQQWDDMFNLDATNEVARQQHRYNNYNELFENNSDYIEDFQQEDEYKNIEFSNDNTNVVNDRIQRFNTQTTYSGIVDIRNKTFKPYQLFTDDSSNGNTISKDIEKNALSELYFSKENIERLQTLMRYQVWLRSGQKHIIDKQSTLQLEIIMRSIYLQYSKNLDIHLKEQINELNQYVLDYAIDRILSGIEQYLGYKKDISTLPTVMDHPEYMSSAGEKSLEFKSWF